MELQKIRNEITKYREGLTCNLELMLAINKITDKAIKQEKSRIVYEAKLIKSYE